MRVACWIVGSSVLVAMCAPSMADDKQFSICRINYVAHWVAKNCTGQIATAELATVDKMRDVVGGTAPDCYRGEGDAKNDVDRMISAGGKANSCKVYSSFIREVFK
jgi:hypothetical protein